MLQTLRGKQKYHVTNVAVEKIKLSRLLVKEIQRKNITVKFKTALTNSNCKFGALN